MKTKAMHLRFFLFVIALGGCQPMQVQGPGLQTEGKDIEIVGGSRFDALPAVGALLTAEFSCTATLITPTRVLTAAHCVHNQAANQMTFVTGPNFNTPLTQTRVLRAVPHSGYNPSTLANDIAYLDLVATPPGVTPLGVVRALNSSWIGTELLHVGYGASNGFDQTGGGLKRAVAMPILSMNSTHFEYGGSGRNTCNGDSGGPALFRTTTGTYLVAGVTSYGDETCSSYGADVRVDAYLAFLGLPVSTDGAVPVPAPAPAPAPTPAPAPAPTPVAPETSAPGELTIEKMRDQNVFIGAATVNYYDRIPVRPGTPFRAVLAGSGDGDLYVRWGNRPDTELFDCRPFTPHTSEVCDLTVPAGVTEAFVAVDAYLDSTYWLDITHQY